MSSDQVQKSVGSVRETSAGARRIAAMLGSILVGAIVFLGAWIYLTTAFTAALLGTGVSVVLVAATYVSDLFETILEAIGGILTGILAVFGAIFGAIFSIFN
jgi:hypothetical protein